MAESSRRKEKVKEAFGEAVPVVSEADIAAGVWMW